MEGTIFSPKQIGIFELKLLYEGHNNFPYHFLSSHETQMQKNKSITLSLSEAHFLKNKTSLKNLILSVTRFGKILPLEQTFKNPRQTFGGLFLVWLNCKPTLAFFINFHCKCELL